MRLPITNETRTSAELQLSPSAWLQVIRVLPTVAPVGTVPLRTRLTTILAGAGTDAPVRVRLTTEELQQVRTVAEGIPDA